MLNVLAGAVFMINLVVAFMCVMWLMNAQNANQRGTNAVTRFVRDGVANMMFSKAQAVSILATVVCVLLGTAMGGRFWAGLPTLVPIVMSFIFKKKSTENAQRVKDSRTVTKGSLEATAAAGEAALTGVGTAVGAVAEAHGVVGATKAGSMLGKSVGSSVAAVADKAGKSMTDVEGIGITKEDMHGLNTAVEGISDGAVKAISSPKPVQLANPEEFMAAAKRIGVAHEGEDINVVAGRVFATIPNSVRDTHPDLSEEQLAMKFLKGDV